MFTSSETISSLNGRLITRALLRLKLDPVLISGRENNPRISLISLPHRCFESHDLVSLNLVHYLEIMGSSMLRHDWENSHARK